MSLRLRGELIVTLLFLALFAWAVYQATFWPPRTKLFPLAVGIPALALVVFKLGRDIFWSSDGGGQLSSASGGEEAELSQAGWLETGKTAAWLLAFFVSFWAVGILLTVVAYTFAYLRFSSRESWGVSALGALGAWLFTWGLFDQLLHLPFPPGALFELVIPTS